MSPLSIHERIDEIAWDQHYKNIAMEEEESELADWFERSIKDRHIQECVKQALAGKLLSQKQLIRRSTTIVISRKSLVSLFAMLRKPSRKMP